MTSWALFASKTVFFPGGSAFIVFRLSAIIGKWKRNLIYISDADVGVAQARSNANNYDVEVTECARALGGN